MVVADPQDTEGEKAKSGRRDQDERQVSDRHSKRIMKRPAYLDSTSVLPKRRTLKSALALLGEAGERALLQKIESQPRTGPKLLIKEANKTFGRLSDLEKQCAAAEVDHRPWASNYLGYLRNGI
jgi:hypothetical protein